MNLDHLEQLTSEANSGVVLKNMKIHMALSPSALGKLNIFCKMKSFDGGKIARFGKILVETMILVVLLLYGWLSCQSVCRSV